MFVWHLTNRTSRIFISLLTWRHTLPLYTLLFCCFGSFVCTKIAIGEKNIILGLLCMLRGWAPVDDPIDSFLLNQHYGSLFWLSSKVLEVFVLCD